MSADKNLTQQKLDFEEIIIAISTTTSAEVDLVGMTVVGFYMPAAFTGTAITFEAATTKGGTFVAVEDGTGSAISVTVSADKYIKLNPADFAGIQHLKLVSGSTEVAARTITLATRQV